jgi:hypothetical protein
MRARPHHKELPRHLRASGRDDAGNPVKLSASFARRLPKPPQVTELLGLPAWSFGNARRRSSDPARATWRRCDVLIGRLDHVDFEKGSSGFHVPRSSPQVTWSGPANFPSGGIKTARLN